MQGARTPWTNKSLTSCNGSPHYVKNYELAGLPTGPKMGYIEEALILFGQYMKIKVVLMIFLTFYNLD